MEYTVIIHKEKGRGYWAEVPALDGCFSQGATVDTILKNVQRAIKSHLIALKSEGRKIPKDDIIIFSRVKAA